MKMRSARRAVASVALVAAGAAAGLVFGPELVGAQEDQQGEESAPDDGPGCHRGPHRGLEAAAEAIGIEVDALREAVQGGRTIAQVAQANGVDVQTVIDAMVADATERIDAKVAEGDLTQERADDLKAGLTERVTAIVNGERPAGGPGPRGPHGEGGDAEPGAGGATETQATSAN